ncbi:MAG TPA: S8 family serine peptidase [Vicinamibacterales bacterium]
MKLVRVPALTLIVVVSLVSFGSRTRLAAQQPAGGLAPEGLAQIDALIAEKDSRSAVQQKIDSQLLYQQRIESGQPIADGIWSIETDVPYAEDGHVVVDVTARAGSDVVSRMRSAGIDVLSSSADGSSIRAHIDLVQVEPLAADADVIFIQPRQDAIVSQSAANLIAPTGQGSRSSEGDVTHLAFAARGAYHIDGTGLKIGVLSDGVRNLAASQARGDLGSVTVIGPPAPCPAANTCDEGTAMLEIIHDLVPGAQLYFASANISITSFADNIRALRTAGCDIIVDDVFYFVETPFQDGQPGPTSTNGAAVIQAVNDVTADGALYFSSAGNSGNLDDNTSGTWEGDFVDGGPTAAPVPTGNRLHSFGAQTFNVLTAASTNPVNVYWTDPLGASANDYDLFRLNAAGTTVLASSTNIQSGTQDPYEQVTGSGAAANQRIVIVKKAGAADRFLHLGTNRGRLSIPTAGEIHGHAAAANADAVAATPAVGPFPQPFSSSNVVETFSSDGPRRVFFQANGTPYTPGNVSSTGGVARQKPEITAADGVSVTGVGGFPTPFFGTSAAAPHAAAIAALVKSANPALSRAQIHTILTSTAIDIQGPGVDRDSGFGIIMAPAAVGATGHTGTAFLQVDALQVAENPGDGDGAVEIGEGAKIAVTLKNYGVAPATAISGVLSTPGPGVTLATPSTVTFPDLPPGVSATSGLLRFTTTSDVGCPGAANFNFVANYTGGTGPLTQPFVVPIGVTSFSITRNLNGTTPPSFAGIVRSTGTQNFRLNRQDTGSVCGAQKPTPPISAAGGPGARQFDAYAFTTCGFSTPSCVSVTFSGPNSINMFSAAYVPTFDPNNITANYKADPAVSSSGPLTYSFDVPAGSSQFAVDVHDVPVLAGPSNSPYTLTVSNACLGSCEPPNHPPVAKAKAVTVPAGPACTADASVDDGSFDPDGDPLTFVQVPPGPYALGTTSPVQLTVTDSKGAFSQANGAVTVVDASGPIVTGLAASPGSLWPPNHKMVDVTLNFSTADNCSSATCVLAVSSNEAVNGAGDGNTSPDWEVIDAHHVRLRAERAGGGSGRIYTLTLTCTDAAGNATIRTATVVVSHNP